jgi:hypothetical protein
MAQHLNIGRRDSFHAFVRFDDLAPGGVVHADGDHKIHVINVRHDHMALDPRFDVDFNRDIATGPARPHGVVMLGSGRGTRTDD